MKSLDRGIAGKRRQRGQRGSAGSGMGRGGRQERFASRPELVENLGSKSQIADGKPKESIMQSLGFLLPFPSW